MVVDTQTGMTTMLKYFMGQRQAKQPGHQPGQTGWILSVLYGPTNMKRWEFQEPLLLTVQRLLEKVTGHLNLFGNIYLLIYI